MEQQNEYDALLHQLNKLEQQAAALETSRQAIHRELLTQLANCISPNDAKLFAPGTVYSDALALVQAIKGIRQKTNCTPQQAAWAIHLLYAIRAGGDLPQAPYPQWDSRG